MGLDRHLLDIEKIYIKSNTDILEYDLYRLYTHNKTFFINCIEFQIKQQNDNIEKQLSTLNFSEKQLEFLSQNMKNNIKYNIDLSQFNSCTIEKYFMYLKEKYNNIIHTNLLEYFESFVFANYILDNSYYNYLISNIENTISYTVKQYILNKSNVNNTYLDIYISTLYYLIQQDTFILFNKSFTPTYNNLYDDYLLKEYCINTEDKIKDVFIENIIISLNKTIKKGYWKYNTNEKLCLNDIFTILKLNLIFYEDKDYIYNILYEYKYFINQCNYLKKKCLWFDLGECIDYVNKTSDKILHSFLIDLYRTQYKKINIREILSYEIDCLNTTEELIISRLKILNTSLKLLLIDHNNIIDKEIY